MTDGLGTVTGGAPLMLGVVVLLVVAAGATAAVSLRDARAAVLGLLVAILAAPFLVDPLPDLRGVAARVAGGILAAYPLIVATRNQRITSGSRGGWPADAMIAMAAAVTVMVAATAWAASVGAAAEAPGPGTSDGVLGSSRIHLPPVAGGAALMLMSASPLAFARDPLRIAIGLILAVLGITLLLAGLTGPPSPLVDYGITLLLVALGGGGWALMVAGTRDGAPAAGRASPAAASTSAPDSGGETFEGAAEPAVRGMEPPSDRGQDGPIPAGEPER